MEHISDGVERRRGVLERSLKITRVLRRVDGGDGDMRKVCIILENDLESLSHLSSSWQQIEPNTMDYIRQMSRPTYGIIAKVSWCRNRAFLFLLSTFTINEHSMPRRFLEDSEWFRRRCRSLGSTRSRRCHRQCRSSWRWVECRVCWAGTSCQKDGSCTSHRSVTACSWSYTADDDPLG